MGMTTLPREIEFVMESKPCVSLKGLAVNGEDLLKAGVRGREIGNKLQGMLEWVLRTPEDNTKEKLLSMTGSM